MPTLGTHCTKIAAHESVTLFPTYASLDAAAQVWNGTVHGTLFAPGPEPIRRLFVVRMLGRLIAARESDLEGEIFRRRVSGFLRSSRSGRRLAVRIGSNVQLLADATRGNGHFGGPLRIPVSETLRLRDEGRLRDGWLDYQLALTDGDDRLFRGAVRLVEPEGISVISDIDDTIKHSEVTRGRILLRNTFLRNFETVPGMAETFRAWGAQGAVFHYVSSSPWQLYDCLADLFVCDGLPAGTFHLKHVGLKDPTILRLFIGRRWGKRKVIMSILSAFPHRRFVLVGDSGEKDPEIYGAVARRFRGQVARVFIRNLPNRGMSRLRCAWAFRRVPCDTWRLYEDAAEIEPLLPAAAVPAVV
jgi:phosphatidate phosphatase APP1